ncbi:MAG: hypothetical protein B5M49_02040 [Thermotoga sp. 4484_232]|nr:MAG: hypothetical protein B5M49_02040 [Thermotoga sp. 4484_232]RKX55565.1 MAG: hypothetical protein DRP24_04735 [Thermotoga sp.]HDG61685.1 DUF4895 domain-containing protein [Thermotoga sp.]
MILGPDDVGTILAKYVDRIDSKKSLNVLKGLEDKLDTYHRHVFLERVLPESSLPVSLMVNAKGRIIIFISLSDPFKVSSAIYRSEGFHLNVLKEVVEDLFKETVTAHDAGIFRLPIKTRFLSIFGDDEWIKKELLRECVKSEEYFGYAKKVSSDDFKKILDILKHKNPSYDVLIDDDGVHVFLKKPEWVGEETSLVHEMAVFLRRKYGFPQTRFSGVPFKAFLSMSFNLEEVLKEEDFSNRIESFLRKLRGAYEHFVSFIEKEK